MPLLIRFMLHHLIAGFAVGALTALSLLRHSGFPQSWIGVWLYVFSLGAPFALGSLATALAMDAEED